MKIDVILIALILISVPIGITALLSLGYHATAQAISVGAVASVVYIVIGFVSMLKSFGKPSTTFYKIFFIALAARFILFIVTLYIIHKYTSISIAVFGISFTIFYILFQSFEIRFMWKRLESQKTK